MSESSWGAGSFEWTPEQTLQFHEWCEELSKASRETGEPEAKLDYRLAFYRDQKADSTIDPEVVLNRLCISAGKLRMQAIKTRKEHA